MHYQHCSILKSSAKTIIQRTVDTAAKALYQGGIKQIKKRDLNAKFCREHNVDAKQIQEIQQKLDALRTQINEEQKNNINEVDSTGCVELIDEEITNGEKIKVYLDSHQNKHQKLKIGELPAWTAKGGTKFASNKGLQWHKTNTAETIKQWALQQQNIGKNRIGPKKEPLDDGYIYDANVFKEGTVIYVFYHCNPTKDES